jgi:hypothetical protein
LGFKKNAALALFYSSSTWAFFALSYFELNCLAFLKRSVALGYDLRMVHEEVLAAFIGANKTKTFAVIEPLNFTCTHFYSLAY